MRKKTIQCKHIDDARILTFLADNKGPANWYCEKDGTPYHNSVAISVPFGTPQKLLLKKMEMMVRRGVVDGCACGCRGDFSITEKGLKEIKPQIESNLH